MRFSCNLLKRKMEDYEGIKFDSSYRLMETDPSLGPGEIRQVKRCVNAMEIALDEIDEYEPRLFFRIVERLAPIIEGEV